MDVDRDRSGRRGVRGGDEGMGVNMNVQAFKELIESVERRPEERFDMDHWARFGTSCGTVCCAFGSFVEDHGKGYGLTFDVEMDDIFPDVCRSGDPFDNDALELAWEVFDIDIEDAEELFIPKDDWRENKKAAVLARVRQYLADHAGEAAAAT